MHSLIKKRAQERKLEKEKAEKAQLLAEAWIGESQPQAVVPSHVPVSSRESSPTLTRLRSALGSTQRDGDDSDRNESTVGVERNRMRISETLSMNVRRQQNYTAKLIEEFKGENPTIKLRVRHTPCPVMVLNKKTWDKEPLDFEPHEEDKTPGVLNCRKWLQSIQHLERNTRPDLSLALNVLQRSQSSWHVVNDRLLCWMFGYLETYPDLALVSFMDTRDRLCIRYLELSDASAERSASPRQRPTGPRCWRRTARCRWSSTTKGSACC